MGLGRPAAPRISRSRQARGVRTRAGSAQQVGAVKDVVLDHIVSTPIQIVVQHEPETLAEGGALPYVKQPRLGTRVACFQRLRVPVELACDAARCSPWLGARLP